MKKKNVMKLLTLILTGTLMLSMSMTAFATEGDKTPADEDSCCITVDGETICEHKTAEECDMEDCEVHAADKDEKAKDETEKTAEDTKKNTDKDKGDTVSGNTVSDKSTNDKDTAKAGKEEVKVDKDKGETLNADVVKDETSTVKTGEFDMIPIIVGLGIVAVVAGAGFTIYKKKHQN